MYKAYIVEVKNIRKHENADRLQIATFFGNDTVVGLDVKPGDLGVYFPVDGQLSEEFCQIHNLVRRKDDAGNEVGGFLEPGKRNIKAIRLRGEKSDGLYMPISCFDYCYPDIKGGAACMLNVGDTIDGVLEGHEICCKYIPRTNPTAKHYGKEGNKTRKHKVPVAPLFTEHVDTEQLAYNLEVFKPGDEIEITLKMHGTSQRTGYLPVLKGYKRSLMDIIFRRAGKPIYDWGYVSGTRRVVLEDYEGGFYGSNAFREQHSKVFEGKLRKGETVYYEVVGFTDSGTPIMGNGKNAKVSKEFEKQYGKETVFSYGCSPTGHKKVSSSNYTVYIGTESGEPAKATMYMGAPQSDIYVYRMNMTNEDGEIVEYTPDFMRYRCEQMGVKCVPLFAKGYICMNGSVNWINMLTEEDMFAAKGDEVRENDPFSFEFNAGDSVKHLAEYFYDGPDPIGKTHIREGVVVRIINKPKFCAYKHKNFSFKVLEGIVKSDANAPDMEEAQEVESV